MVQKYTQSTNAMNGKRLRVATQTRTAISFIETMRNSCTASAKEQSTESDQMSRTLHYMTNRRHTTKRMARPTTKRIVADRGPKRDRSVSPATAHTHARMTLITDWMRRISKTYHTFH